VFSKIDAVHIVGYNLDEEYYVIKNSWGVDWGRCRLLPSGVQLLWAA